jgi:alpha-D-xyloside xylohydrolase
MIKQSALLALLALSTAATARAQSPLPLAWEEAAPGIWRATVGTPESIGLLKAAGAEPRVDALARMPAAPFPLPRAGIQASSVDGAVVLRFPLGPEEQLYGLGLNFKTVQQRGQVKELHVDHYGGTDNGRTHAPVPFYVSSAGYGVLVDAARYITVYAGTAVRRDSPHPPQVRDRNTDRRWSSQPVADAVEVRVPTSGATIYLFAGPTPLDAVRRFNLLSGGGALPPKWGLGFLHRVPTLFTSAQVLGEVDEFAKRGFPLDVIGLEPGWQSASYPNSYTWDPSRYPDPAGFLAELRRRNIGANLWINPFVAPASPIYQPLLELSGSHTVWTGIVPDYSLPAARRLTSELFQSEHLAMGVGGYKIDEVDGYDRWLWPDHATFPSGLSGEQMRQVYGVLMQRMTDSLFRAENRRTWGLVRGSNAGAAHLPYVIYNDYYSHPDFITALVNSSFLGVLWTPEARSAKTGEEWLRRMQSVCFGPLAMLNAWSDGTKPWSFPEVEGPVREVMLLRERLLPYLYSTFAQYHFEGTPPIRAMALVEGFRQESESTPGVVSSTENPYAQATRRDIRDQYMLGDNLLVAPMFAGDTTRQVILPAGKWYDFYTGAYVGAGEVVTARPGIERIPLYVRDGGLIPLLAPRRQVPRRDEKPALEVPHYGEAAGSFAVYDDDGQTFGYEQGEYSWTELRARRDGAGRVRGEVLPRSDRAWSYGRVTWTEMPAR